MKIRAASVALALGMLAPMVTAGYASQAVGAVETQPEEAAVFYLNGQPLQSVEAQCIDGTYYVTLASVMNGIDPSAVVEESDHTATVTAEYTVVRESDAQSAQAVAEVLDTLTLTAAVGEKYLVANGRYLYAEDGIITVCDEVAVPIRLLAKALNLDVDYDSETMQVLLTSGDQTGYLEDGDSYYNSDDLYWLSRIISCESGNQSLTGKIAVGNVVMNRVASSKFPNTVYSVIFQKNQFSPASSGSIKKSPNAESVVAAKLVMEGVTALDGVLFFNRAGASSYASRNRTYVATIGDHAFYA
jgi:N-acetylmuramoyl-L-alanine amidase